MVCVVLLRVSVAFLRSSASRSIAAAVRTISSVHIAPFFLLNRLANRRGSVFTP